MKIQNSHIVMPLAKAQNSCLAGKAGKKIPISKSQCSKLFQHNEIYLSLEICVLAFYSRKKSTTAHK